MRVSRLSCLGVVIPDLNLTKYGDRVDSDARLVGGRWNDELAIDVIVCCPKRHICHVQGLSIATIIGLVFHFISPRSYTNIRDSIDDVWLSDAAPELLDCAGIDRQVEGLLGRRHDTLEGVRVAMSSVRYVLVSAHSHRVPSNVIKPASHKSA